MQSTGIFMLPCLGLKEDNTREIISIINIPTESSLGWRESLRELKSRGVEEVSLFVTDDQNGLGEVIKEEFPESLHQKCVLHFTRNQSKNVRIKDRKIFNAGLRQVFNPESLKNVDKCTHGAFRVKFRIFRILFRAPASFASFSLL